jgi:hypothetical protein
VNGGTKLERSALHFISRGVVLLIQIAASLKRAQLSILNLDRQKSGRIFLSAIRSSRI